MLIEQILNEWEKDNVIDELDISGSALRSPNLHAKYLRVLIDYKLKKVKYLSELDRLSLLKSKWMGSNLTTEELNDLGWEPFNLKVLKADRSDYIDADPDIQKIKTKIEYCTTAIYTLESILKEIASRSFHTRVAMDWIKFRAGS